MKKFLTIAAVALLGIVGCDGKRELKVAAPYGPDGKIIEASAVEETNWRGRTESTTTSRIIHPNGTVTTMPAPTHGGNAENIVDR